MFNAFRRFAFYRQVIVNLEDDGSGVDKAIAGVFWRQAGPLIVIKDATLLAEGQEPVKMDGETIIERRRVTFIQAP
jgi:hypothetical protein